MPTAIPAKTSGSLGEALTDTRTAVTNELSAVHLERIKSLLIELSTEIGATGAPAAGSILERLDSDTLAALTGTHDGDVQRTASAFSVRRHNWGAGGLPTVGDDSGDGYSVGSIWAIPGQGALMCVDATPGAAVWGLITPDEDTATIGTGIVAIARANSEGVSADAARVDHVHDGGVVAISVKLADFTLTRTDEVVLISTGAGPVVCGPDGATITSPRSWLLKKISSDTDTITIQPPTGHSVEGGAINAPYVLPGSAATDLPAWTLVYQGGTSWWVVRHL